MRLPLVALLERVRRTFLFCLSLINLLTPWFFPACVRYCSCHNAGRACTAACRCTGCVNTGPAAATPEAGVARPAALPHAALRKLAVDGPDAAGCSLRLPPVGSSSAPSPLTQRTPLAVPPAAAFDPPSTASPIASPGAEPLGLAETTPQPEVGAASELPGLRQRYGDQFGIRPIGRLASSASAMRQWIDSGGDFDVQAIHAHRHTDGRDQYYVQFAG